MKYVIINTRSNGLPLHAAEGRPFRIEDWPRMVEFAFLIMDGEMNIIQEYSSLVNPDIWQITPDTMMKGYSMERSMRFGSPCKDILAEFVSAAAGCDYLIAHNMGFHLYVASAELLRYNLTLGHRPKKICTMLSTVEYVGLNDKWPKLSELYKKMYGCLLPGKSPADDVRAVARCFGDLVRKKIIELT